MAYHPGVGVVVWRLAPPHFFVPVLLDTIRQNYIDGSKCFEYNYFRTIVRISLSKGGKKMLRNNEEEFFKIIRENDNPEQAAVIAIKVFAAFLARLEANQELPTVCLRESS